MAFDWKTFWYNVKKMGDNGEQTNNINPDVKKWEDINEYNPLDIVVKKLGTLVNDEATIKLESDSTLVQPLNDLCVDIEQKRYEICSIMLGKGGCYVTMATNQDDEPYHRIIPQEDASVYSISAGKIYEIAMIIDRKTIKKQKYTLIRHHYLDDKGTLYIYYYSLDSSGRNVIVDEWERYKGDNTAFYNANHIGVTYFKSPQDSNGLEPFFGVPLNFACKDEEQKLIKAKKMCQDEMKNAEMKIFADDSILRKVDEKEGRRYDLPENIYAIRKKAGVDGSLIDSFAPTTRYNDYKQNVIDAGHDYEDRIGLNAGFVTPPEYTAGATATEIRTANVKTISMMKKVQTAEQKGFADVLIADSMFLNIPCDLWSLKIDWYNPFEDEASQWQGLLEAYNNGAAEIKDLILFRFPNLTPEEIEEKIVRISKDKEADTATAIDKIYLGG